MCSYALPNKRLHAVRRPRPLSFVKFLHSVNPPPMPLPQSVREVVDSTLESFYLRRVPPDLRGEIRLSHTIRGNTVLLSEARPAWKRAPANGLSSMSRNSVTHRRPAIGGSIGAIATTVGMSTGT